ncbi:hypothetical protein AB3M75_19985 [Serratia ureilytica]|uniref:hypothetical protein n=1 Tax=Serratia ureilytica TaxID=300181 RepID=UPI00371BDACB
MIDFKGTPGPWNISFHGSANCWVVDSEAESAIAKVVKYHDDAAIQKANFDLIAASPDLFRVVLALINADVLDDALKAEAVAAVKKAVGL